MAKALADMRLVSSCNAILQKKNKTGPKTLDENAADFIYHKSFRGRDRQFFLAPDKMEDEPLKGVDMGSTQLIDDGIHSPDHLPFVLQTWKEK